MASFPIHSVCVVLIIMNQTHTHTYITYLYRFNVNLPFVRSLLSSIQESLTTWQPQNVAEPRRVRVTRSERRARRRKISTTGLASELFAFFHGYHNHSHDSSVGEWMYITVCPLDSPGLIFGRGQIFQRIIPCWSHVLPCTPVWEYPRRGPQRLPAEWCLFGKRLQSPDD